MAIKDSGPLKLRADIGEEAGLGTAADVRLNSTASVRDLIGKGAGVTTRMSEYYSASASGAVDSWTYNASDYIVGVTKIDPGDRGGINRSRCPWNATGAAFDGTNATKGSSSYASAITYTESGTGGGTIRNYAQGTGFQGPINSQYPNDSKNVAYCEALYPFQRLKPGTYTMHGTSTANNQSGRWAEVYVRVICFSTWGMSDGIGYVSGSSGASQTTLGGRNISSAAQSGTFTVPVGYEYVCVEFRNANNVYSASGQSSKTNNIYVTKQ